jgi:hypothetical protein
VIAPLLASDKRLALGKQHVDALAEIAAAAHGIPRPALDLAIKRLIDTPQKLTVTKIRDEIDRARQGGAMFVIKPGMPQWQRWIEHLRVIEPAKAKLIEKLSLGQVPAEWPPARNAAQPERGAA